MKELEEKEDNRSSDHQFEVQSPFISTKLENTIEKKRKMKYIFLIMGVTLILALIVVVLIIFLITSRENGQQSKWDIAYMKAEEFISKLNLTERVNLLFGTENMKGTSSSLIKNESEKEFLCVGRIDPLKNSQVDFKGMCLQDGPAGVRFANGTSISWQAAINTAATFNKTLMHEIGKAQGQESKIRGINTLLAPCVNMLRSPQGGRVWEAFGDDPFYSGVCATEIVKGIQEEGVIASVKHFVTNDQETYRKASSSNVDMATLMDIYIEPFYRVIHYGDVGSILSSYNAINNSYCDENKVLLTDILRGILNFRGFVVSDWWGVYSNDSHTINSGLDMNMPGGKFPNPDDEEHKYDYIGRNHSFWTYLEDMVEEKRITEAATRIIATMYHMNQMDDFPDIDLYKETKTDERKIIQRRAATESQVLLKNEGILPLKNQSISKLAIVGSDAFEQDCIGGSDCSCKNATNEVYNGHMPLGYGSGTTSFGYLVTPAEAIKNLSEKYNIEVLESGNLNYTDEQRGNLTVHVSATEDIEGGISVASESDVVIIFVSSISGEEYIQIENSIGDRADLNVLHNGNELIESIAEINENVIVVINAPCVVNLPWIDKVKAIIFSGYPGAESGNAIADILFGEVNPSGHLPFVWGELDDYPAVINDLENLTIYDKETGKTWKDVFRYDGVDSCGLPDDEPGHDKEQYDYNEGLFIGQRWFNKKNIAPIFPFGFGLSYSSFEYSDLNLNMDESGLTANFKIKNNSTEDGQAVPMMFLTFPESIGEYPKHIFKGFEKIEIKSGETKSVSIKADEHALSYFNVEKNNYIRVNQGKIKVCIAENGDPSQVLLTQEIEAKY